MFNPLSATICTGEGVVSVVVISAAIVVVADADADADADTADVVDVVADAEMLLSLPCCDDGACESRCRCWCCCNSSTRVRWAGMKGFLGGNARHADGTTDSHRCDV